MSSKTGVRWSEDVLKTKLEEFGVSESEMAYICSNYIDDGHLTVRKLRPIANDTEIEHKEVADKVKAMLKSIGELRSKSIFAKGYRAITGANKEKSEDANQKERRGIDIGGDSKEESEASNYSERIERKGGEGEDDSIEIDVDEEEASLIYTVYTVEEWDLFYGGFVCGGDVDDQIEADARDVVDFDNTHPRSLDEQKKAAPPDAALVERLKILALDRSRYYLDLDQFKWTTWRPTDNGVELYTTTIAGHKGVVIRTTCRIQADKETLRDIFLTDELTRNYDDNLAKTEVISSDVEAGVYCKHFYYYPYFPARQRDTVFCSVVQESADTGDILISSASFPRKMYKDKNYTRAFIISNSTVISPSSTKFAADSEGSAAQTAHCQVTFLNQVDTGGLVPTFLTDTAAPLATQAAMKKLKNFAEAMEREGRETPLSAS